MTHYLDRQFDWRDPALLNVFDEVPLWSALFGNLLLDRVPLKPDMTILDLACGAGFPLLELAERLGPSCRAVGLDTWLDAMQRARSKIDLWGIDNVVLVGGDGAAAPFAAATFDLITSNLGVNNFADAHTALRECARLLKPDGQLILTTNLRGHMDAFYTVYRQTLHDLGRDDLMPALAAHINHRVTVGDIEAQLANAGLIVQEVVTDTFTLRYLDGTALLNHSFIGRAFLEAWYEFIPVADRASIFAVLETNLNVFARQHGELRLDIPAAYVVAGPAI